MVGQYKIVKKQSIQALKKYERVLKNYEDTDHKILKNTYIEAPNKKSHSFFPTLLVPLDTPASGQLHQRSIFSPPAGPPRAAVQMTSFGNTSLP
jgi:hypothetical protein